VSREDLIDLLEENGFSVSTLSIDPDGSEMTSIITHKYTPELGLGFIEPEILKLKEDVLPPDDKNWYDYKLGQYNDAAIVKHILTLKARILTQDTRMRRQRVENMRKYFRSRALFGTGQEIIV
jgi:hypothetical protein